VKNVFFYDSLESTNVTAKDMANIGTEHGTVIIANSQTAGRGRYGRSFYSPSGHGLYMSIILHTTKFRLSTPALLTLFSAVAVCRVIENVSNISPKTKWVNDIFVDGKKVCGILTEAVSMLESSDIHYMIVGIGINLTTPDANFPDELKNIAGSLFKSNNPPVTRDKIAFEIIQQFLSAGEHIDEVKMLDEYKQKMFLLGKKITVSFPGSHSDAFDAIAIDVDNTGRLVVQKENGEIMSLHNGDITTKY